MDDNRANEPDFLANAFPEWLLWLAAATLVAAIVAMWADAYGFI